jgi:hypothetical protein
VGITTRLRKFSDNLPYFNNKRSYADKEKLGRGRMSIRWTNPHQVLAFLGRVMWRFRSRVAIVLILVLLISMLNLPCE